MGFNNAFVRIREVDVDAKPGSHSTARDMVEDVSPSLLFPSVTLTQMDLIY